MPNLIDLSLMRFQGIERPVSLFDGCSMVEIQRSQQLQAHRLYPLKQRRRSPHSLRLTVEETLRPFPCLRPQERTPHLSWSDSGTPHISFGGESDSLALQNASYGVDHLSAELKKLMSKRMRPPRRPRRVCMPKESSAKDLP